VTREEIARIIDPDGWATFDRQRAELVALGRDPDSEQGPWMYVQRSLAKADAILAGLHPSASGEDAPSYRDPPSELPMPKYEFQKPAPATASGGTSFSSAPSVASGEEVKGVTDHLEGMAAWILEAGGGLYGDEQKDVAMLRRAVELIAAAERLPAPGGGDLRRAAQAVVDAAGQMTDGSWQIIGDGELLISDLSNALVEPGQRKALQAGATTCPTCGTAHMVVDGCAVCGGSQPLTPQETWHQRFVRLVRSREYALAVAMLRAPAPLAPQPSDRGQA